ncbi:hypothetical protein F4825DRAFT_400885 [Nemania diffusa]|nr:hypothetical protein F4825DRAFT_400885 [Nemania diffusa]
MARLIFISVAWLPGSFRHLLALLTPLGIEQVLASDSYLQMMDSADVFQQAIVKRNGLDVNNGLRTWSVSSRYFQNQAV